MKLTEETSYLKGLIDGLDIDDAKKENKIIIKMADIIADLSKTVEVLQTRVDDLTELCDDLDKDRGDVEEDLYCLDGYDDDDDEDYDDDDYDYDTDALDFADEDKLADSEADDAKGAGEDDSYDVYEIECPTCNHTISLTDEELEDGSVECPNCGEKIEYDLNDITIEDIESQPEE